MFLCLIFLDTMRVHIRKFRRNNYGHLVLTTMGVMLSPVQWQTLANDLVSLNPPYEKPEIVNDCIMLSMVDNEDSIKFVLQRYVKRKDYLCIFTINMPSK